MKKLLSISIVIGILVSAVVWILLILDVYSSVQAKDILTKMLSVVGVITLALILIFGITKISKE